MHSLEWQIVIQIRAEAYHGGKRLSTQSRGFAIVYELWACRTAFRGPSPKRGVTSPRSLHLRPCGITVSCDHMAPVKGFSVHRSSAQSLFPPHSLLGYSGDWPSRLCPSSFISCGIPAFHYDKHFYCLLYKALKHISSYCGTQFTSGKHKHPTSSHRRK